MNEAAVIAAIIVGVAVVVISSGSLGKIGEENQKQGYGGTRRKRNNSRKK